MAFGAVVRGMLPVYWGWYAYGLTFWTPKALLFETSQHHACLLTDGEGARLANCFLCRLLAQEAAVFDFGARSPAPVVLLLDRRDDPVTPLLTQWTYQVGEERRQGRCVCRGCT